MNCNNFQSIADELARGRLMDAAQREDALAHADTCGTCAARLADGRALTAGLRTLAAQAATLEAPARVESALLAAFRQRHAADAPGDAGAHANAPAAAVTAPSSNGPVASLWRLPRWAQGAAVAAASVLLVVGLYGIFREGPAPPQTRLAKSGAQKSDAAPEQKREEKTIAAVPAGGGGVSGAAEDNDANVVEPERRETEAAAARRGNRAGGGRAEFQAAKFNGGGARRPSAGDASAGADSNAPAEIATDFFPLMNGGQLAPGDAGHVIRVEVPRTALASFGLPVNADRAGGRVKADVLMGEDGMARAIRFVH